mmetsp:Transcript_81657/g.236715  ORF Transcript_81657/g.236715 Transcript_81657/m.236715 type:complete len:100 (+) Transcript_81657:227-526(+)
MVGVVGNVRLLAERRNRRDDGLLRLRRWPRRRCCSEYRRGLPGPGEAGDMHHDDDDIRDNDSDSDSDDLHDVNNLGNASDGSDCFGRFYRRRCPADGGA